MDYTHLNNYFGEASIVVLISATIKFYQKMQLNFIAIGYTNLGPSLFDRYFRSKYFEAIVYFMLSTCLALFTMKHWDIFDWHFVILSKLGIFHHFYT